MASHYSIERRAALKKKFPSWVRGYAQHLYRERGLTRMQVQGTLYINTGFDVSKHTLKVWLYKQSPREEG